MNISTDSKCALLLLHAHVAIWEERGFLTAKDTPLNYGPQILSLLEAVHLPQEVAVVHFRGHRKGQDETSPGSHPVHQAVLSEEQFVRALIPPYLTLFFPHLMPQQRGTGPPKEDSALGDGMNPMKTHTLPRPSNGRASKGSTSLVIVDEIARTRFAKRYLLGRDYAGWLNGYVTPAYFAPITTLKEAGHPNWYNLSGIREVPERRLATRFYSLASMQFR